MYRDPETIQADIDELRNLLAHGARNLDRLHDELAETRAVLSADERHRQHLQFVIQRYECGEYVAVGINTWWCRDGQLLERATPNDIGALHQLERQGLIACEKRQENAA
ncbi:hypothetical protein V6R97_08655 [Chromohalobacter salexigens]|uniref:hypothetical protein n=1 Tax=Chromohalobacter israelensis TaxID=141390 RepID=UPI0032E876A6